jgi:hypothetical protein
MPYQDPDPGDPNVLVGVSLPATRESLEEMARAFAEEFAALGLSEAQIFNLFRRPFYAGAHQAYRALGEAEIAKLIRESLAVWGGFRVRIRDARPEETAPPLIQIDVSPKQ